MTSWAYVSGFKPMERVPHLGQLAILLGTRERPRSVEKINSFQWWIAMNDTKQDASSHNLLEDTDIYSLFRIASELLHVTENDFVFA